MYEAVRDASPVIEAFLSADEPAAKHSHSGLTELKAEIAFVANFLAR
jgi:hypothetical protein